MPWTVIKPAGGDVGLHATAQGAIHAAVSAGLPTSKKRKPREPLTGDQVNALWSSLKRSGWRLTEMAAL